MGKASFSPLTKEELAALRRLLAAPRLEAQLDAGEVAKKLGKSRRWVLDQVRAGFFPHAWKPAHNQVSIPEGDVVAFIEERRALVMS